MNTAHRIDRDTLVLGVLDALYLLADRHPDASSLALRLGATPSAVADALLHLEKRGLADAGSIRLTLRGLAAAAALNGASRSRVLAA
jgi:Mn-dependent DtxR family transcriptional regulator